MRFWDASAIVPLLAEEPRSPVTEGWLGEDAELVVWWGTPVECASAIARLEQAGSFDAREARAARARLDDLRRAWFEVQPVEEVRRHALRLLRTHPLRASDALQLAAALTWSGSPGSGTFHTFDARLADAAAPEGFTVPPVEA